MRRVNARPWLGEASVVVVAAHRLDMILSSRALVPGTDLPCANAHGFPDVDAKHVRAFANKFQQIGQEDIPRPQSHEKFPFVFSESLHGPYGLRWVCGSSTIVRVPEATRASIASSGNAPAKILCSTLNRSTANGLPAR
jgi:hypothetical protein